jgi:hypothetical protein
MLIELSDELLLDAVLPDGVVETGGAVVVSVGVMISGLAGVEGEFEFEDEFEPRDEFEFEFEPRDEFEFDEFEEKLEAGFDEVEVKMFVELVGVKSGRMIGAVGVVGVTSVVVGAVGVGVVGVTGGGGGAATVSAAPLIVTVSTAVSVRTPFETV